MKNNRNFFNLMGLFVFALFLFSSCTKEEGVDPTPEETKFTIKTVNNNQFGYILTDQNEQSMYFFAEDVKGESKCSGGCGNVWPPVTGDIYDLLPDSYLDQSDFGTITRADGQKQITYKGWPLYYFSPEGDGVLEQPREVLGDGRGGVFHVAKPDYAVLLGKQVVVEGEPAVVYLTDDRGVSLYLNTADEKNVSNCSGGCANVWPPFKKSELIVPSSLEYFDLENFNREDDLGLQLSFEGFPLYYFSQDEQVRGRTLGNGGGPNQTFFVIQPEIN